MSYKLVIVESPAKCQKIEGFLGQGYKCIASFGHIQELKSLSNIDIENNFNPTFSLIESKQAQINKIKKMINNASEVILASDDDREGEGIAWHICKVFNLSIATTKRIIFNEVTKTALQAAISNVTTLNMNLVNAQQARQILDLIVGYSISPILWNAIGSKSGLSAGRCQTPALRLIYDNQKEIERSPGKKLYNTVGYFTKKNFDCQLNYCYDNEDKLVTFLELSTDFQHVLSVLPMRNSTKNPPKPFTTSSLQQQSSNELRISPKETMTICQKLYEGGYITYMRTDSRIYSKEFVSTANSFIEKKYGKEYISDNINNSGKKVNAQEAHEAIRPTHIEWENLEDQKLTAKDRRLYNLIRTNTLESLMKSAKYNSLSIQITAPEERIYKHNEEQVVDPGWKIVSGYEKENKNYMFINKLESPQNIAYNKIYCKLTIKDLKQHYTEAKLVNVLEEKGIGRPSTFSSLVDKIQQKGYVTKGNVKGKKITCSDFELENDEITEIEMEKEFGNEKGKLIIEPIGILVIEFLIKNFNELFEYDYTKDMEMRLDMIANGEFVWHDLCKECLASIKKLSKDTKGINEKIKIDENHTFMVGKYGPIIKYTNGSEIIFKKIKPNIDINKLKNGEYKLEEILNTGGSQRELGEYKGSKIVLKNGRYGAYVEYNEKKYSIKSYKNFNELEFNDVVGTIDDQKDNSNIIKEINKDLSLRRGKYGIYIFYKKSNWKQPQFIKINNFINKTDPSLSITDSSINDIKDWLKEIHNISS